MTTIVRRSVYCTVVLLGFFVGFFSVTFIHVELISQCEGIHGRAPGKGGVSEAMVCTDCHGQNLKEHDVAKASEAMEAMRWYNDQRAYPDGVIPLGWREKALRHVNNHNLSKGTDLQSILWTPVGPTNIGGRVRSIAIDPNNPSIIYAGSVSGGIWKSTDGGASWIPKADFASNMVIGCLAIDPTNSNIIYAGTGEGYFNVDALRGIGVLKSTDAGETWTVLNTFISAGPNYYYYFINKIVINPTNPQVLFAAVSNNSEGIWKSTNGGTSWNEIVSPGYRSKFCVDLIMDPTNANTLYGAFGLFSADGIYKTTNGGTTWDTLTNGFPLRSTKFTRISLAVAPSNTNVVYACLSDSNYYTHSIQKSTNGGANWFQVGTPYDNSIPGTHLGGQGWYNNVIAVHPDDPDVVFTGGINLFKSTNGGQNWFRISDGYASKGTPLYVHVDQHAIVFHPDNSSVIYFGNDGGLFTSANTGTTFTEINSNFQTVQFYSGAVHPTLQTYYGGTQDNGTVKTTLPSSWSVSLGGDGGATWVDSQNPQTVYTEYVYMCLQKSTNAGFSWSRIMNGIPTVGSNQYDGTSDRSSFIAPFVMDPGNPQTLVAGSYRVFRTSNGGTTWSAISVDLTGDGTGVSGSVISALGFGPSPTIYVGTSGSGIQTSRVLVTTNGGSTWINQTRSPLPNRYVKAIAVHPSNRDMAYVCFSGYGGGHIFMTTTHGNSWSNISGDLPDIPVNAILFDSLLTTHLVAGTDIGIFETTNGGTNWIQQNGGMANVSVADLDMNQAGYMFVATHGRGMFKSDITLGVGKTGTDIPGDFVLDQNYPNPFNPTTMIGFSIPRKSQVELAVYDVLGRRVALLEQSELSAGFHGRNFDASHLASGVYFYVLTIGDGFQKVRSEAKKMIFTK